MRLRQIALVGRDLAAAKADIEAVLGLGPAYLDPGVAHYGLVNQVWPIGDTFLEVVSPSQPGTTAERLIDKRGGDGGYMAIFQTEDIEAARARFARLGVRVVSQADRDGVHMTHLHPKDMGGAIVSIDQMIPPARWEWGGPGWQDNVRTEVSLSIVGAELQAGDPDTMSARWAAVLDRPRTARDGGFVIPMDDGGEVRFVAEEDGRGEGLGAFDVAVRDPAEVRGRAQARGLVDENGAVLLCGTRVRLAQA
ncbi:MAG: hypothetical protein JWO33_2864 [Caulobacteraceae bacterium]|nr:hypothetical protein [Caulobacteraceae bacterium]